MAWLVRASCAPHTSREAQSRLWNDIRQLVTFTIKLAPSVLAGLDDESRKRAIGAYLTIGGRRWLAEHQAQAKWMSDNKISADECIRAYQAWHDRQMSFEGWQRVNGDIR